MFQKVQTLAGLKFDQVSIEDLLEWMASKAGRRFGYLVTPNVDHLVRVERQQELEYLYSEAEICVCDSRVLATLSRIFRLPVPEVVPGSDLIALAAESGFFRERTVTIVGGREEMVSGLINRGMLGRVFHLNPPMGFAQSVDEFSRCVAFVESQAADIVLFAVGSPQQEQLANAVQRNGRAVGAGLCIGASLLFLSGEEIRAPRLVQRMRLEWLFRLLMNPRRLARRYLVEGLRIFSMLKRSKSLRGTAAV